MRRFLVQVAWVARVEEGLVWGVQACGIDFAWFCGVRVGVDSCWAVVVSWRQSGRESRRHSIRSLMSSISIGKSTNHSIWSSIHSIRPTIHSIWIPRMHSTIPSIKITTIPVFSIIPPVLIINSPSIIPSIPIIIINILPPLILPSLTHPSIPILPPLILPSLPAIPLIQIHLLPISLLLSLRPAFVQVPESIRVILRCPISISPIENTCCKLNSSLKRCVLCGVCGGLAG
uniref:Uncharacterized protein n=1 Tax=Arcella intermedia TaxID=1963864 RepID=A0A6B2LG50_9EUKA